jgi:cyclohexanone monooxygenase
VQGRGGRDLDEAWRGGAEAFLGTAVSGFPNLFMIVGPNSGLGHTSLIYMIEAQIEYILSSIKTMRARGIKLIDVKKHAQDRYNARLHARFPRTVWSSGCVSWYRTASGKNTTLWPGFTFEYRLRTRRFSTRPYEVVLE